MSDEDGKFTLCYALESGNPQLLQMILKENPSLIDMRDGDGKIALH